MYPRGGRLNEPALLILNPFIFASLVIINLSHHIMNLYLKKKIHRFPNQVINTNPHMPPAGLNIIPNPGLSDEVGVGVGELVSVPLGLLSAFISLKHLICVL